MQGCPGYRSLIHAYVWSLWNFCFCSDAGILGRRPSAGVLPFMACGSVSGTLACHRCLDCSLSVVLIPSAGAAAAGRRLIADSQPPSLPPTQVAAMPSHSADSDLVYPISQVLQWQADGSLQALSH